MNTTITRTLSGAAAALGLLALIVCGGGQDAPTEGAAPTDEAAVTSNVLSIRQFQAEAGAPEATGRDAGAPTTAPTGAPTSQVRPAPTPTGDLAPTSFHDYVVAVVEDVAEYWRRELPAVAGTAWTEVNYHLVDGDDVLVDPHCGPAGYPDGGDEPANPAFWCPESSTLYLSTKWLQGDVYGIKLPGQDTTFFGVAVVIAHEFGHAVQSRLGIAAPAGAATVAPVELQADCLAGTWSADENRAATLDESTLLGGVIALSTLGDTITTDAQHHGRPAERVEAYSTGFDSGDPNDCTLNLKGAR